MNPLDRPILHSLATRHAAFALKHGKALRFTADVSPFAACTDDGTESLHDLAQLAPESGYILLLQAGAAPVPSGTVAVIEAEGVQMVAEGPIAAGDTSGIVELGEADAPEMLELAALTNPGPFLPRTHMLGSFVGIREKGRLVAMAGERLKLPGFTEVSGVCTHPEARGQGHAARLSALAASRIQARGETAFLHAFAKNASAIRLYERLGFRHRTMMAVLALKRA